MSRIPHIVVLDDEADLTALVASYFAKHGFRVTELHRAVDLYASIASDPPDLVLLDVGLPDDDGIAVARRLRRDWNGGLVFLTGRGDAVDKVVGLEVGADDYVTKPFELRELLARVRSILRRTQESTTAPVGVGRRERAAAVPALVAGPKPARARRRQRVRGCADRRRVRPARGVRREPGSRAVARLPARAARAAARPRRSTARSTSRSVACGRSSATMPRCRRSSSRCAARATCSSRWSRSPPGRRPGRTRGRERPVRPGDLPVAVRRVSRRVDRGRRVRAHRRREPERDGAARLHGRRARRR